MNGAAAARSVTAAIARYGETMQIKRRTVTGGPYTMLNVRGTIRSYDPGELVGRLEQGDAEVIVSPDATVPVRNDTLVIAGRNWTVLSVEAIRLSATPVAYRLWARGG